MPGRDHVDGIEAISEGEVAPAESRGEIDYYFSITSSGACTYNYGYELPSIRGHLKGKCHILALGVYFNHRQLWSQTSYRTCMALENLTLPSLCLPQPLLS
jgi:hypothetical protein